MSGSTGAAIAESVRAGGFGRSFYVISAVTFLAFIVIGMVAPVRPLYARSVGLTFTDIGVMAAGYLVGNMVAQFPVGWLIDRFGHRGILMVGFLIAAVSSLSYLVWTSPAGFVVLRFLEGATLGSIQTAARTFVANSTAPEQRGTAFGLLSSISNSGFVVGPVVGGVVSRVTALTGPYVVAALSDLLAALTVLLVLGKRTKLAATPYQAVVAVTLPATRFLTPELLLVYLIGAGLYVSMGLSQTIWSIWLSDLGYDLTLIGLSYAVWTLPAVLGTPVAGRLVDRSRRIHRYLIVPGLFSAAAWLALGHVSEPAPVLLLCAIQGVTAAPMIPATDAYLARHSPVGGRGRTQGIYFTTAMLGALFTAFMTSQLYPIGIPYPFYFLAGITLATVVVAGIVIAGLESGGKG